MNKNISVGIVVVIVAIVLVSLFVVMERARTPEQQTTSETQPVLESPEPKLPKVLYNLTGRIETIEANAVVFDAVISFVNAAGEIEQKTETRKAVITPTTKITRLVFVTQPGTDSRTPRESQISLGSLQAGDLVEVLSNRDISSAEEFEATQIRLLASG